jgi:hypothetical protein
LKFQRLPLPKNKTLEEEFVEVMENKRKFFYETQQNAKKHKASADMTSNNRIISKKLRLHLKNDAEELLGPEPIIVTTKQCQAAMKELSSEKVIAADLEWAGEGRQAILSLLQIANDHKVYFSSTFYNIFVAKFLQVFV